MDLTLSADEVRQFLHHLHIIPLSKGLTHAWMDAHAPSWPTDQLLAEGERAIVRSTKHFSGYAPAPG